MSSVVLEDESIVKVESKKDVKESKAVENKKQVSDSKSKIKDSKDEPTKKVKKDVTNKNTSPKLLM